MSGYSIESKKQRMKEDAAFINDIHRWPQHFIRMKSQPWHVEPGKWPDFGTMHFSNRLQVEDDNGSIHDYATLEELVEQWSVD